jgi:hypothetical protein
MDRLINIINNDYQNIFNYNNEHIFFKNIIWWKSMKTNYFEFMQKYKEIIPYDTSIDLSSIKLLENCKYIPNKVISKKMLEDMYLFINDPKNTDIKLIQDLLLKMYDYNIPSNIPNINEWKKYNSTNIINVLILGGGPLGLFTALYLHEYYNNKQSDINGVKINILIIDNRIKEEGIRLPYTRVTQFGFDITQIQPFIKQIFCWTKWNKGVRKFDFINVLENLLYLAAFNKNISMYYTKKLEDFEEVKKFINKHNIQYLFDCTGGRLKNNLKQELDWSKYNFKKDNYEIILNKNRPYYEFYEDGKLGISHNLVVHLLDKNKREFPVGNYLLGWIEDEDDARLVEKYNNMCMSIDDYFIISSHFKSKYLRNIIYDALRSKISKVTVNIKDVKYVKITKYDDLARHKTFCATKINDKCVYFGLGDTLGGSDLGIWFGMKHSLLLSKHICNLLSSVKYF